MIIVAAENFFLLNAKRPVSELKRVSGKKLRTHGFDDQATFFFTPIVLCILVFNLLFKT